MRSHLIDTTDCGLAGWPDAKAHLTAALARDEFALYCQPVLSLCGAERYPLAELLVRLREEEKALLPPGDFLPVFEHYGMLPELDRWVVRAAASALAQGMRVPVLSINVSSQTLDDAALPSYVADQLSAHGVPPSALLLEIDESDTLQRLEAVQRLAAACREVGVSIVIDGFGRDSVSFSAIKAIGPRFVKIDGAITRRLLTSELAQRKLDSLLAASGMLGFALIAECVEEQDVLTRLKALGVGYAQGFGIYEPQAIEHLAARR